MIKFALIFVLGAAGFSFSGLAQAHPAVFERAFFNGSAGGADSTQLAFTAVEIGQIRIESGKIIACDPIVIRDAPAFSAAFPKGVFPVQLAIAQKPDSEQVAFSRILFSGNPVARWEATTSYKDDTGFGLFIDSVANAEFGDLSMHDNALWQHVFTDEMNKHGRNGWNFTLFDFLDHNLAAFSTGSGGGQYVSYIGYDGKGKICRLLTDFGLVDWAKMPSMAIIP